MILTDLIRLERLGDVMNFILVSQRASHHMSVDVIRELGGYAASRCIYDLGCGENGGSAMTTFEAAPCNLAISQSFARCKFVGW